MDGCGPTGPSAKRQRCEALCNTLMQCLTCPITMTFPAEPVFASDGHVYDRQAIQRWLQAGDRSPMTNQPITDRLVPAHIVRSMTEQVQQSGIAPQELFSAIAQRQKEQSKLRRLEQRALAGDARSMFHCAFAHQNGKFGLGRDLATAREWFRKSAEGGYPPGIAVYGSYLLEGKGGPVNSEEGVTFVSIVADDSDLAAYELGNAYQHGLHGVEQDLAKARELLSHALGPGVMYHNLAEHAKKRAAADLDQLSEQLVAPVQV